MSEFNNVNATLDTETLDYLRKKMEEEKKEKVRQARLNAMLHESENKDVNKALYEQGGLRELIEKDPEILDSEASIRLALQTASSNYKNRIAQEELKKKQEEQARQEQLNKTTTPLTPQNQTSNAQQTQEGPKNWTEFSREELEEIFKQDPRYAGRAKEMSWTVFGTREKAKHNFYSN